MATREELTEATPPGLVSDPIDLSLLPATTRVEASGRLSIGGVDLLDAAAEFGTPVFVYDEEDICRRFDEARAIFGPGVAYATKAFLCKAVARLAYQHGLALDVSTGGEYHVCRAAGVPADHLVLHGNNKPRSEVERAIAEGVAWIVLDSLDEIEMVGAVARALQTQAPVMIRVNPGVEVHTHRFIATGNRESKFGIPLWTGDADRALKAVRADPWLNLRGIHSHVGSLVFSVATYLTALDTLTDFVKAAGVEYFVVGGGLGVRYLNTDTSPTFSEWGNAIIEHCRAAGIAARVLAEPGRSMVAPSAVTLYTVGGIATKGDRTYVAVDGGMSDNPRPLLYDSGYEVFLVREALARRERMVDVVGRHCESGDTLIRNGMIQASTSVGDIICTPVTGAYGYTMASNYNKMPRPPIVFVSRGEARVVVRRETFDDLLLCDVG